MLQSSRRPHPYGMLRFNFHHGVVYVGSHIKQYKAGNQRHENCDYDTGYGHVVRVNPYASVVKPLFHLFQKFQSALCHCLRTVVTVRIPVQRRTYDGQGYFWCDTKPLTLQMYGRQCLMDCAFCAFRFRYRTGTYECVHSQPPRVTDLQPGQARTAVSCDTDFDGGPICYHVDTAMM